MNLADWSPDRPSRVVDLRRPQDADELVADYAGRGRDGSPLAAVMDHARALGASTAVVEHRYLDPDWRSEHAAMYSKTFRRYPGVAHRLHFFRGVVPAPPEDGSVYDPDYEAAGYLGYAVLRPVPGAPVGRTVLPPLEQDERALTCQAWDDVTLFGHRLPVIGAPFTSGDGQLGGCGHASVWTTAYYHHREVGLPRQLPARIAEQAARGVSLGRPPQPGSVTVHQLHAAYAGIGLDPLVYDLDVLDADEDVHALIARYLDSGLPVTVAGSKHTYVLVGYADEPPGPRQYLVQDDDAGPYRRKELPVPAPGASVYVVIPLPSKVYLPGEQAEAIAEVVLAEEAGRAVAGPGDGASAALHAAMLRGAYELRTVLLPSNTFKARAGERYPAELAAALRYHPMPRWVWAVQVVVGGGVVAEALVDATQGHDDPHLVAWWLPGEASLWLPDEDVYDVVPVPLFAPLPLLFRGLGLGGPSGGTG